MLYKIFLKNNKIVQWAEVGDEDVSCTFKDADSHIFIPHDEMDISNLMNDVTVTPDGNGGYTFVHPQVDEPIVWTESTFRDAMTLSEKVAWDNDSSAEIKTAKIELRNGIEDQAVVSELADMLVSASIISAQTKANILS